jgi:hypothetical protein
MLFGLQSEQWQEYHYSNVHYVSFTRLMVFSTEGAHSMTHILGVFAAGRHIVWGLELVMDLHAVG